MVSYEYTSDPNRYLDKLIYGNGDYVAYDYDSHGRVILETFEDGSTVSYQYDNAGALATMTDSATGRKTTYYYDLTDRLMKYVESGSDYKHSAEYGYDNLNNLNWLAETINGVEHTTNYTYDEDNRLTGTTYVDLANGNDVSESIEYDAYGRMSITRVKNNDELVLGSWFQYTYSNTSFSDTTHLGGLMVYGASGYTLNSYYSYDANGNITRYSMTGGNDAELLSLNTDNPVRMGEVYYHYDTANQLVREDNMWLGKTFVWSYDDAGNITSCKEYEYIHNTDPVSGTPKKTNTYTYGDSSWGDLVTVRNGTQWSYDQIGNLVTDGTWTYLWNNGRELEYICSSFANWYCTYDANGMRTSRSSDTKTYTYVYNGSQLTQMTVGNDTLYFTYGAIGPTTVTWNGTTYYYAVNGQGDVIGIFDGSGNCVVTYNWDNAWGDNPKPEGTMAATLGTLNPLRYRSYVYDTETELYYLQSRYYNPEIGRFINADAFVSTGQGLLGNNMFAYCGNNPGSRLDISGCAFTDIFAVCFGEVINLPNYLDKSYEIGDRSIISKGTISINMVEEAENIRELSNYLSVETISIAIAISACDKYYATYGEEFLLSDLCVAYEIEEHIYAYYFSTGNRAVPNLLVAGYYVMQIVQNGSYAAGSIYSATRMIDMRESDVVVNGYQAIVFGYKHGIRDTYIGTDRDPWASSR